MAFVPIRCNKCHKQATRWGKADLLLWVAGSQYCGRVLKAAATHGIGDSHTCNNSTATAVGQLVTPATVTPGQPGPVNHHVQSASDTLLHIG
jgi:hypothetical protein